MARSPTKRKAKAERTEMKNPWPLSEEELAAKFAALRLAGRDVEWANEEMEEELQIAVCDHINTLLPVHPKQAGSRTVRVKYQPPRIIITGVFCLLPDGQVDFAHCTDEKVYKPNPETGFDWGEIVGFFNRQRARLEGMKPVKKRRAVL